MDSSWTGRIRFDYESEAQLRSLPQITKRKWGIPVLRIANEPQHQGKFRAFLTRILF